LARAATEETEVMAGAIRDPVKRKGILDPGSPLRFGRDDNEESLQTSHPGQASKASAIRDPVKKRKNWIPALPSVGRDDNVEGQLHVIPDA
jgi:hypothetical protein